MPGEFLSAGLRLLLEAQTLARGNLVPPELADGFGHLIQPVRIPQQRDQLDGAKIFTEFGFGLPSVRSLPALTRMAASSVVQLRSFDTGAVRSRAGKSFAAQVVIAACITLSVMFQPFSFRHRNPSQFDTHHRSFGV